MFSLRKPLVLRPDFSDILGTMKLKSVGWLQLLGFPDILSLPSCDSQAKVEELDKALAAEKKKLEELTKAVRGDILDGFSGILVGLGMFG